MAKTHAEKWIERKLSVITKFDYHCAYCGCDITLENFQIDHIVPKSEVERNPRKYALMDFNVHGTDNLNPACRSCNNYKSWNSLEEFRAGIEAQVKRFRKHHPMFRLAERYGMIQCTSGKVVFYFEQLKMSANG